MEEKRLIEIAKQAKEFSYSPYSGFRVGAALLGGDGRVFTGCNIENCAYGPSNCAERTAIFKAVSEGCKRFKKIAIISDGEDYAFPCGVCRQVLAEFAPDIEILVANVNGFYVKTTLKQLLPNAFSLKEE